MYDKRVQKLREFTAAPSDVASEIKTFMANPLDLSITTYWHAMKALKVGDYSGAAFYAFAASTLAGRHYDKNPKVATKVIYFCEKLIQMVVTEASGRMTHANVRETYRHTWPVQTMNGMAGFGALNPKIHPENRPESVEGFEEAEWAIAVGDFKTAVREIMAEAHHAGEVFRSSKDAHQLRQARTVMNMARESMTEIIQDPAAARQKAMEYLVFSQRFPDWFFEEYEAEKDRFPWVSERAKHHIAEGTLPVVARAGKI